MSSEEVTSNKKSIVKVGSRKSKLALIQTDSVIDDLKKKFPLLEFETVTMSTIGDKILDTPLAKIGEKSLFTKELEVALEDETVDFVVHSLKDLPTTLPPGMVIGAVCKREDPRDAVMFHPKLKGKTLAMLPKGSIIGTSSLRRMAQIRQRYENIEVRSVRGNLNTRLAKLESSIVSNAGAVDGSGYSALLLAASGMERMGWKDKIGQVLEPKEQLYAVGQGALAVECRASDLTTLSLLSSLHHRTTVLCVAAERSLLKALGGGCSAPVAVHSKLSENEQELTLEASVWSLDGKKHLSKSKTVVVNNEDDTEPPPAKKNRKSLTEFRLFAGIVAGDLKVTEMEAAETLGEEVAKDLIKAGAVKIMNEARAENELSDQNTNLKEPTPEPSLLVSEVVVSS